MGSRIAEIDEHTIAHVFRNETTKALHGLCNALLVRGSPQEGPECALKPTSIASAMYALPRSKRSSHRALDRIFVRTERARFGPLPLAPFTPGRVPRAHCLRGFAEAGAQLQDRELEGDHLRGLEQRAH